MEYVSRVWLILLRARRLRQDEMAPIPAHFPGARGHPARLCANGATAAMVDGLVNPKRAASELLGLLRPFPLP